MDDLFTLPRMIQAPTLSGASQLAFFDPTHFSSAFTATLPLLISFQRLLEHIFESSSL